jgi:dTDP-glucose 4,6-dehydratase
MLNTILVTGGCGFIGSNFVLQWVQNETAPVINLDLLTYAGNPQNLESLNANKSHEFVRGDIGDRALVADLLQRYQPRAIVHFAAESHVDRSIHGPEDFIRTNVLGTFQLVEAARNYWMGLSTSDKEAFRFLHVSTDEVYGTLGKLDPAFCETTAYAPNSPYAASKAGSDHVVRAYFHTYGFPTLITNCSNNYGPRQFPEKLIPLVLLNCVEGKPVPIYGDGLNVRDWLYVEDHCEALRVVLGQGRPGQTYNIGGLSEKTNLEVVRTIFSALAQEAAQSRDYEQLIRFVTDRPGHDRRYAIDCRKLMSELGWKPRLEFAEGIRRTVRWYLDNMTWVDNVRNGAYHEWLTLNYSARSGA